MTTFYPKAECLAIDSISGRTKRTTLPMLEGAERSLKDILMERSTLTLNDVYKVVGFPKTALGETIFWTTERSSTWRMFYTHVDNVNFPARTVILWYPDIQTELFYATYETIQGLMKDIPPDSDIRLVR